MLLQLNIRNIALIDEVDIELGEGLNILTGETGAGKSIIIDSINAILGERVSKDLIRTGKDRALVEAVFIVDNGRFTDIFGETGIEPEEDGTLIISREFSVTGKNTCRINGKMATVSMVRSFGERLVDIHGQHDNQSLLRVESHSGMLDSFGGDVIRELKELYSRQLNEYREISSRLKGLTGGAGEREKKIDLLRYQTEEIRKAKLKVNEEEDLNKQRLLLSNSEKISGALSSAYELLFSGSNMKNSAIDIINEAFGELQTISKLDEKFKNLETRLNDLVFQLEDVAGEIRSERDGVEFDPGILEEIDERLDVIFKLKRKYGGSISEVLSYCSSSQEQLDELQRSEEIIDGLEKRLAAAEKVLFTTAVSLNAERKKAAAILEDRITVQLEELEMKKARFKVEIRFDEAGTQDGNRKKYGQNGLDRIEFLISPNAGEPLKPLAKIASGGEMSRIMLAIKTILADVDSIPTLIFDEIDIGISGKASQKVAEKLSYISRRHQAVCVTHLPQIASMADNHFLIEKISGDNTTKTSIRRLEGKSISGELARMLGGDGGSERSLAYAEELISNARKLKGC
ncbi:MAG: DNA repair protein RecN [Clostridiales bacterium]|nr:DNA repair protein RecN [Clostridiales bacterium]